MNVRWLVLFIGAAATWGTTPAHAQEDEKAAGEPTYAVTIVESRPRPLTASTSRVTARDFAAAPRRNAEDALRLVPGLTLVQHGSEGKGHQFFLRGFDAIHGSDFELTVEGVPVNEWSNVHAQGYIDLGFVIPEVVSSVEVTKGPFTLGQGAFAMAGSADYQLGVAEGERGLRTTYTVGSTNRHRGVVTFTPSDGDGRDFIATEALHDDGFGVNRGIDRSAVLGRVRLFDSQTRGTLSLLGSSYVARFELPGTLRHEDVRDGRVGFYGAYDRAARGLSTRQLFALTYAWRDAVQEVNATAWGGYRHLELLENYTGFLLDPVDGDRRTQAQHGFTFGATAKYTRALVEAVTLEAGLGTRGDVFSQRQDHVGLREEWLARDRDVDVAQLLSHGLLGVRWRPTDGLNVTFGGRVDVAKVLLSDHLRVDASGGDVGLATDADERSEVRVAASPRLTAEWRVQESVRLFAAYGRGFRPPEARAFSSFEPDQTGLSEDLYRGGKPAMTTTDSVEVGTRWLANRYLGANLSGFATFVARESIFDHVSGLNLELNATRRVGAELSVLSNPVDWLTLSADATYVDARFVQSGNPVPLAPWLTGGFRAVATHVSGWRGGMRFSGFAPRPLPHGARGAAFGALDLTGGYRSGRLSVDLELENVLNRRLREGEYHYASHWRTEAEPSAIPVVQYVAGPPFNARLSLTALF